jgi:hypothetical protein
MAIALLSHRPGIFRCTFSSRATTLPLILALACTTAANADIWHNGDLITYPQSSWGGDPTVDAGAALLNAPFDTLYSPTFGVTVGSVSGFTMATAPDRRS